VSGVAAHADYPAEVGLVLSNRADPGGLAFAASKGIETAVVDHKPFGNGREAFEHALDARLRQAGVELGCLAGFMSLLTPWFVEQWRDRLINIHPSLLPSFKGLHTHERALELGVRLHGCTVQDVRAEMDDGPIIAQPSVPVHSSDDPDTLSARVLVTKHCLYPHALALVASGKARVEAERVVLDGDVTGANAMLVSPAG
jgi:phosphoribosylglycinamide formyltransferase-1